MSSRMITTSAMTLVTMTGVAWVRSPYISQLMQLSVRSIKAPHERSSTLFVVYVLYNCGISADVPVSVPASPNIVARSNTQKSIALRLCVRPVRTRSFYLRRGRDSNPRSPFEAQHISSVLHSTTLPPLRRTTIAWATKTLNGWYASHMHHFGMDYGMGSPLWMPAFGIGIAALVIWSLLWKGLALWRAAKRGEKIWFVVFLVVNTAGILELIYLFLISGAKLSDFTNPKSDHE